MVPDFKQMYSSKEAAEAAIKKFKFKFKADRPPGSISIEDAKKAEQEFNIVPADSEEGKVITEKLIGKPKASVTELVTAEKIISDMKNMDPMDAMKEANKVLKREGKYKNLQEKDVERIMEDTNDFIFGRDIPEDPEGFAVGGRVGMVGGGITKLAKKLIKKTKKYKFTGEESLNDLYELERQGKITREDMNVYSPRYLEYLDAQIIKKEKLYTPKEWEKTSEVLKNKMRGRIDPDWEEANFGEDFNWDQARSTEMKQQQQLKDFDIIGRTKNSKGGVSQGLDYLTGVERQGYANGDYVVQAGIKNYLGKQKTATVPIKWKSGKDHPDTELAYITKPEKELLIKLDLHGSMKDGKPNKGPGGIISLNSGGSGNGGSGDGGSGGGGTDTGDMGSEAANNAATDAANASAGIGGGPTDTGDLGSEAANNAATAAAAASVGMGTFSPYSRPGMIAKNISNYMTGNPGTSLGLTALGLMMGMPALGVMNAASSIYGGGRSSSSIGSEQDEDGSGDGGDERTPISSFDISLLTPNLSDSYNLAKNRDYRLYQGANNPFYSMQAVPSGGIKNVYTEFKKGGRVGFALGGLNYLTGL
jgi:hypothetical protein